MRSQVLYYTPGPSSGLLKAKARLELPYKARIQAATEADARITLSLLVHIPPFQIAHPNATCSRHSPVHEVRAIATIRQ